MGYCFETKKFWAPPDQWKQPNYKINVSEDKKKCKAPNIQERKTVFL